MTFSTPNLMKVAASPARVLAVVLNWNGYDLTRRCLEHLRKQDYPALDVLVVDNGSTDGSLDRLAADGLRAEERLALPANLGFTGGMNAGLDAARSRGFDHVWLLNNDAFAEPDCLARLVGVLEDHPGVAITSPRLVGEDGAEQHVGGRVACGGLRNEVVYSDDMPISRDGSWLTGTALLVRVSCLERVGGFDTRFFAYWEDVDLSDRCRAAGWDLRPAPGAVCRHLGGSATGGPGSPFAAFMSLRNQWLFMKMRLPVRQRPWGMLRVVADGLRQAGGLAARGRGGEAAALAAAVVAIARGEVGRPRRLSTHPRLERFLLDHWWGLSRNLDRAAGFLPGPRDRGGSGF